MKRKPPPARKALSRRADPPRRLLPDWDWIEQQYRTGIRSTREIARISTSEGRKVSHVAIEKRAKKGRWTKDLAEEVRRSVHNRLAVTAVNDPNARADAIVDAAAAEGAGIVQSHRSDIRSHAEIGRMLRGQLDEATRHVRELEQAAAEQAEDEESDAGKRAARRAMLAKAVGLPVRATVYRDLMQAERIRITLERQAFGLDEDGRRDGGSLEDFLRAVGE